jgi:hypothetical protein
MKMYARKEVYLHAFLTLAIYGSKWSALRPGRFNPRQIASGTHFIGGWVVPIAVLDEMVREKKSLPLPGIESRSSRA